PHEAGAFETRPARMVELPVGASEDRLVGALDIDRALAEGVKAFEPGLLADAHRGILYVDEVNLLHDHLVDLLLDAAAMGGSYVNGSSPHGSCCRRCGSATGRSGRSRRPAPPSRWTACGPTS